MVTLGEKGYKKRIFQKLRNTYRTILYGKKQNIAHIHLHCICSIQWAQQTCQILPYISSIHALEVAVPNGQCHYTSYLLFLSRKALSDKSFCECLIFEEIRYSHFSHKKSGYLSSILHGSIHHPCKETPSPVLVPNTNTISIDVFIHSLCAPILLL